jgi:hypothetical protein
VMRSSQATTVCWLAPLVSSRVGSSTKRSGMLSVPAIS